MSSSDETCRRVQAFLKSKCRAPSLRVPDAWIEGCVDWYKNSHSNSTNIQDLLDFVAQQWFLTDFEQLNLRSLPVNLQKSSLVNLTDNYVLQLMYAVNIGQSAHSQHSKITKGLECNSEVSADKKIPSKWEPKSKRMLLLHLTDGSQKIQATEYLPISQLHLDLIPGTKILIKGPVECRRGVILLRANNVELLGGEVGDLVQSNAPENVLARIIGKPENPNPVYGSYTARTAAVPDVEQDGDDEFSSTGVSCSGVAMKERSQTSRQQASCNPSSGNLNHHQLARGSSLANQFSGNGGSNGSINSSHGGNINNRSSSGGWTVTAGREKRTLGDNNKSCPPAKKIQQDRKPVVIDEEDMFPDDDDDIFFMADIPMETDSTTHEQQQQQQQQHVRPIVNNGPPFPSSSSSLLSSTTTSSSSSSTLTRSSSTIQKQQPVQPQQRKVVRPFTYLSTHLRRRALNGGSCPSVQSVCVKGFVSTIRGKLEVRAGQWRLCATINDGSAALDVDFSPQILEELIGHSPSSLKSMMTNKEEGGQRLAHQALENAKQSLIRLNCLLHIRWPADETPDSAGVQPKPVVYRLEEIERRHLEMLQLF